MRSSRLWLRVEKNGEKNWEGSKKKENDAGVRLKVGREQSCSSVTTTHTHGKRRWERLFAGMFSDESLHLLVLRMGIKRKKEQPRISEEVRLQIVRLHQRGGLSLHEIASRARVSPNSVKYTVEKWKKLRTVQEQHHPGRPRKMTERHVKTMKLALLCGQCNILRDLIQLLAGLYGVTFHRHTVSKWLRKSNFIPFIRRKKQPLTPRKPQSPQARCAAMAEDDDA